MCGSGWKSLGVLELTALPSIRKDQEAAYAGRGSKPVGAGAASAGCAGESGMTP